MIRFEEGQEVGIPPLLWDEALAHGGKPVSGGVKVTKGKIAEKYEDSKEWWPPRYKAAPKDAPNVVIVLLDDTGFAQLGAFGGLIETPHIDKLAEGGLRFKRCKVLGVKANDMKADFNFADNNLVFKSLQFKAYEGKVTATGNVLLSSPPGYSFTGKIEDMRIGVFLDENEYLKGGLTGKFSGDVAFTAQSLDEDIFNKTFNGRGVLKHKGGRATNIKVLEECAKWSHIDHFNPLQISELETLLVANGGFISTERMYIKNSDMEVDISGRVSLYEEVDLKVSVLFNPAAASEIERDSKALTLIGDENGRGRLNFKVKGTLDDPSFVLDADKAFFKDTEGGEDIEPPDVDVDPEDLDIFR